MTSAEYLIKSVKEHFHSQVHTEAMSAENGDTNGKGNSLPIPCATSVPDTHSKIVLYDFPKRRIKSKQKKSKKRRR